MRRGQSIGLEHIAFGTILGKDGTPLKPRSGDLPQLEDVLGDIMQRDRADGHSRSERGWTPPPKPTE